MIKEISIHNFQCHKNTNLKLSSGVNVVVGTSDSGKSAILRAINWVVNNRPLGMDFKPWSGGDPEVTLFTEDGHTIKRVRSKQENAYYINSEKLEAFGSAVPEEVSQALKMGELNIQNQHDPPFLLAKTPGEVAAHFNSVTGLSKIDEATKRIKQKLRTLESSKKHTESSIAHKETELTKYAYLKKAKVLIDVYVDAEEKSKQHQNRANEIEKILSQLDDINEELNDIPEIDAGAIQSANQLLATIEEKTKLTKEIKSLVATILSTGEALNKAVQKQERLKRQFSELAPDVCPLCGNKWERSKND